MSDLSTEINGAKLRYSIIGNTPSLNRAIERSIQVASFDLSVLVLGESGSGKEFFPKIIHSSSARKHKPYIAVNCGALPEGTIDSELFGHVKGAFTSATSDRKGYFEEADGGTIFLDEVGELPLTTQARLLRVLESGEFLRVGSSQVQKTNVRIVAATNKDLLQAVSKREFREDLYYRLSTIIINVPPLRDRGNDVMLLCRKFVGDFAEKYRLPKATFSEGAYKVLQSYRWPGNVRQLKNIIEQVAAFEAGKEVDKELMERYMPRDYNENGNKLTVVSPSSAYNYAQEREMLFAMLMKMQKEIDELRSSLREQETMGKKSHIDASIMSDTVLMHRYNTEPTIETNEVEYSEVADEVEYVDDNASPSVMHSSMTLEDTEKETIRRALERNDGNRRRAATELNISERTIYRKIKEYGLED